MSNKNIFDNLIIANLRLRYFKLKALNSRFINLMFVLSFVLRKTKMKNTLNTDVKANCLPPTMPSKLNLRDKLSCHIAVYFKS